MSKRIFRSALLCSLLTLLCALALIFGVLYTYFGNRQMRDLQSGARYLAAGVEAEGIPYLKKLNDSARRITLIDADGRVLFDSVSDEQSMENHADREEIREALLTGAGESTRLSSTLMKKTLYYALRLEDGTVLRLASEQSSVLTLLLGVVPHILAVALLAALFSALLSYRLARRITEPINALDPAHPEQGDCYEELTPLLSRLAQQNRTIEAQLREARQKQEEFAVITENMSEGILIIDRSTHLLSYNPAALAYLEVTAPDTSSVLTLNRSAAFREAVTEALDGRHASPLLPLHGRTFRLIANPVRQDGQVAGAVLLILDETEKTEREQLRREFTANVSHELKTPLTSISGFAELITTGLAKPEDVPDFAARIYGEAQRMIRLVSDILRLSELDEGGSLYELTAVDLTALAERAAADLRAAAERQQVTVSVSGSAASVRGAEPLLYELIYNLCDNAIKYNRPGGQVFVTVSETGGAPVLSVRDTGIGIPPAHQQRVFERFYRVDKSHSRQIGGTGLGLSIVKHAAEFHHAALRLESRPNEGTTVTVSFPPADVSA